MLLLFGPAPVPRRNAQRRAKLAARRAPVRPLSQVRRHRGRRVAARFEGALKFSRQMGHVPGGAGALPKFDVPFQCLKDAGSSLADRRRILRRLESWPPRRGRRKAENGKSSGSSGAVPLDVVFSHRLARRGPFQQRLALGVGAGRRKQTSPDSPTPRPVPRRGAWPRRPARARPAARAAAGRSPRPPARRPRRRVYCRRRAVYRADDVGSADHALDRVAGTFAARADFTPDAYACKAAS